MDNDHTKNVSRITMKKTPTFCLISPWYFKEGLGGSEIQNYYIAQVLIKRGWEVHYIRESPDRHIKKPEIDNQIILHAIPKRQAYFKWLNIFHVLKIAKRILADVWYIRGNVSYVFPALVCSKVFGGTTIWNCSHELQTQSRQNSLRGVKYFWLPFAYLNRFIYEKSLPYMNIRITQSQKQKNMLQANLGLSSKVLYNGHPKTSYSLANKQPHVLFIANLKPRKQPHLFLEIARRFKNSEYEFKMIGKAGSGDLMQNIRKTEKESENFRYLGEQPIDETNKLLSMAQLLLCFSESEGFSNVFIQAWMHGVPVISLHVDPDNLIRDNGLGFITKNLDITILAIESLMSDKTKWQEYSERCIVFAKKHFNIEKAVDSIEEMAIKKVH